jgi:hypothetical protein
VSGSLSLRFLRNFVAFTSSGTLQRHPAPYSPSCREGVFSETHMQLYESLFVKTEAKGRCAP